MSDERVRIECGDNVEVLKAMADSSVDSVVTDPPYGLKFMGKKWDHDVPSVELWREVLRVLKPGGHLLSFSGSRTYHRMVVAIEDAGFEIRDQIMWVYGSGMPKSVNVGRVTGDSRWFGFHAALKPAHEPICLARKPLDGTVTGNVCRWGTGALNIDECRVACEGKPVFVRYSGGVSDRSSYDSKNCKGTGDISREGRFPANLIHDGSDEVEALFPSSAGAAARASGASLRGENTSVARGKFNGLEGGQEPPFYEDSGSASRFFYCAKARKSDRNDGIEGGVNRHPTVKPTDLMRYLCRLVTPPGGVVLDPFMGSGSTGRGAVMEGFGFVGIDLDPGYVDIARARIAAAEVKVKSGKVNPLPVIGAPKPANAAVEPAVPAVPLKKVRLKKRVDIRQLDMLGKVDEPEGRG